MKRLTWLILFLAVAVSGVWVTAPAMSQSKVVKIGDLGSKVGVFEGYGKYQTMMMQMAVDELNAKGGVLGHKVEMISEDDETKPAPAVRKADRAKERREPKQDRSRDRSVRRKTPAASEHAVNKRDRRLCQFPMPDGSICGQSKWTEIHHIKRVADGGTDHPGNLITLCSAHHKQIHRHD